MRTLLKTIGLTTLTITLLGAGIPASFADGIIEDKDTIEKRGPGGLDAPTEPTPTPTPKVEEKSASDSVKKSEKKVEKDLKKEAEKK